MCCSSAHEGDAAMMMSSQTCSCAARSVADVAQVSPRRWRLPPACKAEGSLEHQRSVWGGAAVAGVSPHVCTAGLRTPPDGPVSLQSAAPQQASMRTLMHGLRPGYSARGCGASQTAGLRPAHQVAGRLVVLAAKGGNPFKDSGSRGKGEGRKGRGGQGFKRDEASQPSADKRTSARRQSVPSKPKEVTMSQPLAVTLLEEGKVDILPDPWWSTFCNHLTGEWYGQYGAYTPWEGQPEPVWLDENNRYIDWNCSRSVEHRANSPESDDFLRKIVRGSSMDEARKQLVPFDIDDVEGDNIDVEALSYNSNGTVVFDGGHYSAGPDFIGLPRFKMLQDDGSDDNANGSEEGAAGTVAGGSDEDELEEVAAPTMTSVMEQMVVDWGNKLRIRVLATVRIGHTESGEVDVELLRLVVFREVWAGMPGSATLESPKSILESVPCTRLPRATPESVSGEWSCFTVIAVGIEEEDALSGERGVVWVYTSSEDKQYWELPEQRAPDEGADDGGTLWLPGGVLVTFKMVDVEAGTDDSKDNADGSTRNGREASAVRGLCMATTWLQDGGTALQMERYYDAGGELRDVRLTRAVKGGWVGGKM